MTAPNDRYLTLERLRLMIEEGDVDTVVMAFTDMQGRLQGKRLHGRYFLDVALEHGTEGCNYLLAVDIDMNTVGGYAISSWEKGYGDMEFVPDWATLRLLTHLPALHALERPLGLAAKAALRPRHPLLGPVAAGLLTRLVVGPQPDGGGPQVPVQQHPLPRSQPA